MIASTAEIAVSFRGALKLWKGDPQALELFDRSLAGFWRSFFAAVLAAPAHVALLVLSSSAEELSEHMARLFIVEGIAYVISWTAYPLAMTFIVDWLGRGGRYFDYMVPYNWAGLVQILVFLAVAVLRAAGVLPEPLGEIAALVALIAILHFQWYIARIGLEVSATAAAGLVLLDLSLGILVNGLAASLRA
jgi:hypothetical protein